MNETVEFNLATGVPRRIGHFVIQEELGSGAMGSVYREKDESLGKSVALKVIKPELAKEPSARERFLREARSAAALRDHDHIVPVYSVNEIALEDGKFLLYLVMPLLKGETLQDRIAKANGQPLPLNEQLLIARQIAEGLAAAFDEGLVHRDIKPGNIWLEARKDGSTRVKILDFGLARSASDSQLTSTGATLGTPAFMAPEQGSSSDVDHRADLWSLGVILFQMGTGRLPFDGIRPLEVMINAQMQPLPSVRKLNASLADEHVRLIEQLLEKKPQDRIQSAADVLTKLSTIEGAPMEPTLPSMPVVPVVAVKKKRSKRWAVLTMVVMFNAVLFALVLRPSDPKPTEVAQNKTSTEVTKVELKEPPPLRYPATAAEVKRSQQAWAEYLKLKVEIEEDLGGGVKLKMVLIPPGKFRMGSEANEKDSDDDEKPSREVTLSKPFYLGMCEISRGEFRKFVEAEQYQTEAEADGTGSFGWDAEEEKFRKDKSFIWKNAGFPQTDDHPVVNVSWSDAQAFCKWMSKKTKRKIVLPSEAEWEYACRAGSTTRFSFGVDLELLAKNANSADGTAKKDFPNWPTIEAEDGYVFTAPVGKFKTNPFGLHDMHGNVWEWCEDWYGPYEGLPLKDPIQKVQQSNERRILRGGSWSSVPVSCRSANRNWVAPDFRDIGVGFRICSRLD